MAEAKSKPIPYWLPETRTVIVCWMMVSTFIIIMSLLIWGGPKGEGAQLLNTLLGMYVGTGLITSITWWMGSAKGSDANNKMQDKMADAIGSALPTPVPTAVTQPWWNRMTDEERAAIAAKAAATPADAKLAVIVSGPVKINPDADEIEYLVSLNLLTRDRATALQSA